MCVCDELVDFGESDKMIKVVERFFIQEFHQIKP